jgi:lipid-A-disaccharide synthase
VPIIYYISPQLWAWRQSRMKVMKRLVERVLVIFPFEEQIYRDAGVPVQFVGHPLVDLARAQEPKDSFLREIGLHPERPIVALLPGSRPNEVERLLPIIAEGVAKIAAQLPEVQFVVARAPSLDDRLFSDAKWKNGVRPVEVLARSDDVLGISDVAITASGTATVQAALHGRPMVVVYRLSPLTYRLGRRFLLVENVAMVNLIAGRRIVPELIQDDCTADNIAAETLALLTNRGHAEEARRGLADVRARLGGPGASGRAAEAVLEIAESRSPGV